jgi:uncharacterized protein with NRDE domain
MSTGQWQVSMCLILLAYDTHPDYKLVLAANRDEFYDRPTAPLEIWADNPRIAAGRDLRGGGTWMGAGPDGRLGAITNYRDPRNIKANAPTRGTLVTDFLAGEQSAREYLEDLSQTADRYNGFNLIVYDGAALYFYSNREGLVRPIRAGWHGLSNHLLDTPWPKIRRGLELFRPAAEPAEISPEDIFKVLGDSRRPPDADLPETGVGLVWERILAPLFIESEIYGTRSSSFVTIDRTGKLEFHERTYNSSPPAAAHTRRIAFQTTPVNR